MDKFFRYALILFLLFLSPAAWPMGHSSSEAIANPLVGKQAPDAILSKSDGSTASILSALKGKKAILIFWATWCPHCYEDLGTLNDNRAALEQKGIQIILVDVGETKEDVIKYFNRRQMKFVSFIDPDTSLQEPYHLEGVPTLVFIDEKGTIRSMTHVFPSDYAGYFN